MSEVNHSDRSLVIVISAGVVIFMSSHCTQDPHLEQTVARGLNPPTTGRPSFQGCTGNTALLRDAEVPKGATAKGAHAATNYSAATTAHATADDCAHRN